MPALSIKFSENLEDEAAESPNSDGFDFALSDFDLVLGQIRGRKEVFVALPLSRREPPGEKSLFEEKFLSSFIRGKYLFRRLPFLKGFGLL